MINSRSKGASPIPFKVGPKTREAHFLGDFLVLLTKHEISIHRAMALLEATRPAPKPAPKTIAPTLDEALRLADEVLAAAPVLKHVPETDYKKDSVTVAMQRQLSKLIR